MLRGAAIRLPMARRNSGVSATDGGNAVIIASITSRATVSTGDNEPGFHRPVDALIALANTAPLPKPDTPSELSLPSPPFDSNVNKP